MLFDVMNQNVHSSPHIILNIIYVALVRQGIIS
jgi:hypothetical protein